MAQAARLNLRMQKELKLLLTDPPPGASFPFLSPDSDLSSFSLSTIDAQIEGPEGSVYAKGFFKIKVQIPERYPFQPPIVTFATPIYHPNIDNGGRICLDILNLPPKGAWQPSLNISTVLTSIGLLLSEPNPDDGLMCEASREYKYNRQAFDQKARSMTEKYARAGARGNESGSESFQTQSNASMTETKGSDVLKYELDECFVSHKKQCGIGRKLSLECSGSHQKKNCDDRVKGPREESKQMLDEYYQSHENLQWTKQKLSLESLCPPQKEGDNNKEHLVPKFHSSILNSPHIPMASKESLSVQQDSHHNEKQLHRNGDSKSLNESMNTSSKEPQWVGQKLSVESSNSGQVSDNAKEKLHTMHQILPSLSHANVSYRTLPLPQAISHNSQKPQHDSNDRTGDDFSSAKRKKLGLAGKKLSLGLLGSSKGQEKDNKENVAPIQSLPLSYSNSPFAGSTMSSLMPQVGELCGDRAGNSSINVGSENNCGIGRKLPLEPLGQLQGSNNVSAALHFNSGSLNNTPSKPLPLPHGCKLDEQQQPMQDHDEEFAGGIKKQTEGLPLPEAVIVLDSEDSEEESSGYLRSRLLLVRKRLPGKWKAKA